MFKFSLKTFIECAIVGAGFRSRNGYLQSLFLIWRTLEDCTYC